MLRLKALKDQLQAVGEKVFDNDLIITTLFSLPYDYDMIRTIILARDTAITLEEFKVQLVGVVKSVKARMKSLVMYLNGPTQDGVAILLVLVLPHNLHRDIMMEINLHLMLVINLHLKVFFNLMELIFQSQHNSGQGSKSYNNNSYRPRGNGGYKPQFNGA